MFLQNGRIAPVVCTALFKDKDFSLKNWYLGIDKLMKTIATFLSVIIGIYLLICILLYFFQEKMIFFPQTLAKDLRFEFKEAFEERTIAMEDGTRLNALLFTTRDPNGVVLYLHGNAGSLQNWGSVAPTFTTRGYDVFIPDYRGYGKSEGSIESEAQLHADIQTLYDHLLQEYPENKIIVLGHSIGSGMAATVASANDPHLLILQAPFYSLPDMAGNTIPFNLFPSFLIRYKFETGKRVEESDVPVAVLHGDRDEIIYYGSSLKIQQHFKPGDTLITLQGFGHNDFLSSERYEREIEGVLNKYEDQ